MVAVVVMVSSLMYAMFVQLNVMLRSYVYLKADCMHTHSHAHTGDLNNVITKCTYTKSKIRIKNQEKL